MQGWHNEIVNAIEAQKARGRGGMQVEGPALSYAQPSVLRICERHLRYGLKALAAAPAPRPCPDCERLRAECAALREKCERLRECKEITLESTNV